MSKKEKLRKGWRVDATVDEDAVELLDRIADATFVSRSALVSSILQTVLLRPDRVPDLINFWRANLPPGLHPERWNNPGPDREQEDFFKTATRVPKK